MMGTLSDAVVVGHSVLVMIAIQYMLQDYKLTDCQGKYCSPASTDQSYLITNLDVRKDKEPPPDSLVKCVCCRVTTKGFLKATFTTLALLHVAFSVASILVKRRVLNFSKCSWIYLILIIGTVFNALLITRLFNFDTKPAVDSKESTLWTLLAMPLRLVWKTISSSFFFFFHQVLMKPTGLCNWYGSQKDTVDIPLYLCSLSDHDLTPTRFNPECGLAVLSWTYVVTSVLTLHTLINSMNEEQEQMAEQGKTKDLCTQLNNNNNRKDSIDDVEYERFDDDSFVLGWRL